MFGLGKLLLILLVVILVMVIFPGLAGRISIVGDLFIALLFLACLVGLLEHYFDISISSDWIKLIVTYVLIFSVMRFLEHFYLVGYSINSIGVFFVSYYFLMPYYSLWFWPVLCGVYVLSKVFWYLSRFLVTRNYEYSKYDFWTNTETNYYSLRDYDAREKKLSINPSFGLPLQMILASVIYTVGNFLMIALCMYDKSGYTPIGPLEIKRMIFSAVFAVMFMLIDCFVLRKLDKRIDG